VPIQGIASQIGKSDLRDNFAAQEGAKAKAYFVYVEL
jgi:hypothetical protein